MKRRIRFLPTILILILLLALIPEKQAYGMETTSEFGIKNETVYNIDHFHFASVKDLYGKLITSDYGRIVRLVDITPKGEVIINEGPNPFVTSIASSLKDATQIKLFASGTSCTNIDYVTFLHTKFGFPLKATIRGTTYNLNAALTRANKVVIYGDSSSVPGNSRKGSQYEYLGYNEYGGLIINDQYPPDAMGNGPSPSQFLEQRAMTGVAWSAYAMAGVYTGQSLYSQAVTTIGYFSKWGKKLVDMAPASWWLNKTHPRIKIQGIYSGVEAGIAVTQYHSNISGKDWYQSYMIKPSALPVECTDTDDVKATKLTSTYSKKTGVTSTFYVTNNNKDKTAIAATGSVPWKLTWTFSGVDDKKNSVSKSGTINITTPGFGKTFKYGTTYSQRVSFNPALTPTWAGKISFTATFNPNKSLKETDYTNNTASTTVSVTGYAPPPPGGNGSGSAPSPPGGNGSGSAPPPTGGNCTYPPVDVQPRYNYQLDLAVTEIQGQTVDANSNTNTPVKVYRADYSAERNAAKASIDADIANKQALLAQQQSELAALKSQLATLNQALAKAQAGHIVKTCTTVKGKQSCTSKTVVDPAEVAAAQNNVNAKQTEIDKKQCDINETQDWINGYTKEKNDLIAQENQYRVVTTTVVLRFNGNDVATQTVSLTEGQTLTLNYNFFLMDNGTLEAEIDPNQDFQEETFDNNVMDTPVYVASYASGDCGQSSSVSSVVRTVTNEFGTQELSETLSGSITNQSRTQMRAGYGFSYNVQTNYSNQDTQSFATGPKSTYSYFPTLQNYLPYAYSGDGYEVGMDLTGTSGSSNNQNQTWSLPQTYVEEFSGNVFDSNYAGNPNHNPNDTILNGGRKWYVGFNQPDGPYNFTAHSYNAGVNHLSICLDGSVNVNGSFIGDPNGNDDFVKRSINPNHPFNGGVGWNWNGSQSLLTDLQGWFSHWSYPDPTQEPSGLLYKTIKLTKDTIQAIKDYNKTNGNPSLSDDFFSKFPF